MKNPVSRQHNLWIDFIEIVYLVFPPAAIPEAAYRIASVIGSYAYDYGRGQYWQSSIDEISEKAYEESIFKPVKAVRGLNGSLKNLAMTEKNMTGIN